MKQIKGIYVIIDPNFINSEDPIDMTKKVLDGGAKVIQLRNKDDNTTLTVEWAKKITQLCNEYEAVSIINDRVDIACVSGADGVHLGQNDISPNDVEKITKTQLLIGTSNALKEEIEISATKTFGGLIQVLVCKKNISIILYFLLLTKT